MLVQKAIYSYRDLPSGHWKVSTAPSHGVEVEWASVIFARSYSLPPLYYSP